MTHKVKAKFIHFNAQTGKIDYLKPGDAVTPTAKDLQRFPDMFSKVKPPKATIDREEVK